MLEDDAKWFAVTLRFSGCGFNPRTVEGMLGLAPTSIRIAGENWSGRNGREYGPATTNIWCHRIDAPKDMSFQEQITEFLDAAVGSATAIRKLATSEGVEAELFCGFSSANGQGGDTLTPSLLQRIADLGLSLTLDLYPPDVDQLSQSD